MAATLISSGNPPNDFRTHWPVTARPACGPLVVVEIAAAGGVNSVDPIAERIAGHGRNGFRDDAEPALICSMPIRKRMVIAVLLASGVLALTLGTDSDPLKLLPFGWSAAVRASCPEQPG